MFIFRYRNLLFSLALAVTLFSCEGPSENHSTESSDQTQNVTIESVTNALKEDRTNGDLFEKRASLHLKKGNTEAALNDIKVALKIDSLSTNYHYTFAEILFAKGEIVRASEKLKKCIAIDPKEIKSLIKIAEMEFYMQKYKSSLTYLKRVTDIEPYNSQAYYIHGLIFKQLQDTAQAIISLQKSVEYDASNKDAYSQLGILYYEQNNPLAINYLNNALSLDPENTETLYAIAMYYQNNMQIDKSREYYTSILDINPNHSNTHYNLGYIDIAVNKNYQSAITHFNNTLISDSTYALAYYMRGLCWENSENYKNARKDYSKCLDLKTNFNLAIQGMNRLDKIQ